MTCRQIVLLSISGSVDFYDMGGLRLSRRGQRDTQQALKWEDELISRLTKPTTNNAFDADSDAGHRRMREVTPPSSQSRVTYAASFAAVGGHCSVAPVLDYRGRRLGAQSTLSAFSAALS